MTNLTSRLVKWISIGKSAPGATESCCQIIWNILMEMWPSAGQSAADTGCYGDSESEADGRWRKWMKHVFFWFTFCVTSVSTPDLDLVSNVDSDSAPDFRGPDVCLEPDSQCEISWSVFTWTHTEVQTSCLNSLMMILSSFVHFMHFICYFNKNIVRENS